VADPALRLRPGRAVRQVNVLSASRPADPQQCQVRSDLPLYLAVGDADPVNGGLALFTRCGAVPGRPG